jgi:hypothetical protein
VLPPSQTVGPENEKTDRNIQRAKAHSLWIGSTHIEWKLWTGICVFRPIRIRVKTWFFNEGYVHWDRLYWLTFGVSITKPRKEEFTDEYHG